MLELLDVACGLLARGENFVLVRIINRSGSAPRTAGARMLVVGDGTIHGTIGGGRLEARAIRESRRLCREGGACFLGFDLNSDNVAEMDMICGGSVELLLDCIEPTAENRHVFGAWRQMAAEHQPGWAVTAVAGNGDRIAGVARCLLDDGETLTGASTLSREALAEIKRLGGGLCGRTDLVIANLDDACVIIEPLMRPKTVMIFGAGHVAQPTAQMAAMMGFRVAVFDDREEFANNRRFPGAHQVGVLADFERALEGMPIDSDSYLVILTRGHLYDKTVLAQALRTEAGYIGMIGSRHKRDAIYDALLAEGFQGRDLRRVFAPIGLAIGAESPQEIALCIVAELVQQRAAGR